MGMAATVAVDQDKARLLGLTSEAVAATLQTLQQGATVTQYREGADLIPVVARAIASERRNIAGLGEVVIPTATGRAVPLSQVAQLGWGLEQPVVWRRNRMPMLLVRADTAPGIQAPVASAEVEANLSQVEAALPPGYRIEAAGAVEESAKGAASIAKVVPLMLAAMLGLLMVQLQSFNRVAMVALTAPLGLIGVAAALLLTGAPFGFVATLGCIALAGIVMRNSIILVDQIEQDIAAGSPPAVAIVEAAVRRSRPIALTAAAAILALAPLAFPVFWGPMAIAIMGGLVSATVLTLCFVPALYAAWSRVGRPHAARPPQGARPRQGGLLEDAGEDDAGPGAPTARCGALKLPGKCGAAKATLGGPCALSAQEGFMPHEKTKSDNDTSTARSAKAQKADEVQAAGTAKAGGYLGESMVPEGGPPAPTHQAHGKPLPATSRANADGTTEQGTSSATAGKAEKQAAAQNAALTKEQHGRGHRKAE